MTNIFTPILPRLTELSDRAGLVKTHYATA